MTITKRSRGGFDEAHMISDNDAELHAELEWDQGRPQFRVGMLTLDQAAEEWVFDAAACAEAERFFADLKDELIKRERTGG